jgi:hypothetical protein
MGWPKWPHLPRFALIYLPRTSHLWHQLSLDFTSGSHGKLDRDWTLDCNGHRYWDAHEGHHQAP